MKLKLFPKFFLAFLFTTALLVLSMAALVHWSFQSGFLGYLHQVEMARLEQVAEVLERAYAEHKSWEFLRKRRWVWRDLLHQALGQASAEQDEMPGNDWEADEPRHSRRPPPAAVLIGVRLRLLDAAGQSVIGPPGALAGETRRPLLSAGQTVGWLSLRPPDLLNDRLAASFQQQQARAYTLIAALAVLISALVAWWLARQLIDPVRRLAAGARALAAGEYQARVGIAGQDELGQLAEDFNRLALTLERNEQARRDWIADISHELRTPLAVLRGEIEAMQDGVRPLAPESLRSLHSEALGLGKLVEDLYELALSDLGALDYRQEDLDLVDSLNQAVDAFAPRFAANGLALENLAASHPPVMLSGDPRRLAQLFANLLENSLRYTDPGGRLEIALAHEGRRISLDFCDTAPGVPDEALERLFERLYRVDPSRSRALGGAGLGLAICRNIVEAHAGRISAAPSPLGGLWIRVVFDAGEYSS